MIHTDPPNNPPVGAVREPPLPRVEINLGWCKSCSICVAFCAPNALTADDVGKPHLSYPEKCTGCGLCEMMCPDFAIEVFKSR